MALKNELVFAPNKLLFENIEDSNRLIVSTGNEPTVLTATGSNETLDGGVNGTDDTLISAGKNTNTHFAFHKNGGNDVAPNFDFGGNKDVNDVVLVDSDYGSYGLVKGKSGAVTIGSETEGSLTLLGDYGQNTFAYKYSGIEGIVSVDMSENGMNMSFDYTPDFFVGQGKNSSLIFETKDVLGGTGEDGVFSGFGWNTRYWGESIGTIDARNSYVATVNGDSVTDQVIYASKLVGTEGSPESVGNKTYVCGGFVGDGTKFVDSSSDTLYGSENGNTTFFIGQYLGSDSAASVVDGDNITLLDTSWDNLTFNDGGENYISGKASNGNVLTVNTKNKLSDLNNVTVQFADVTFNAKGSDAYNNSYDNTSNDMVFGKGEGNETFYTGKDMGNDVIYNISSGDKIVLSNTKTSDLYSRSYGDNSLGVMYKNGARAGFYSNEKLANIKDVTIQFDDITYNLVGNNTDYNRYNSSNDIVFGSGDGNSTFTVGKNLGSDILANVVSGDRIVFSNTKYTDVIGTDRGYNYIGAGFSNGAVLYLATKNSLSDTKDVILQFSDSTLKWDGSNLSLA